MAITAHLRVFPLSENEANSLRFSLARFRPDCLKMKDATKQNVTVEITDFIDVYELGDRVRSSGLLSRTDVFLSIDPEMDTFIEDVPDTVVKLIALLTCKVVISGTL